MSTFEFLGCLTAELFEILKGRLKRSISSNWDEYMAGFANKEKMACPICEKYVSWTPEAIDTKDFTVKMKREQEHAL